MGSGCSRNASVSSSEHLTENSATESLYSKANSNENGHYQGLDDMSVGDLLSWMEKYENLLVTFHRESGIITWCNSSWKRDLGFHRSELIGKLFLEIIAEELTSLITSGEKSLCLKSNNGEKRTYIALFDSQEEQVFGCFSGKKPISDVVHEVERVMAQEKKLFEAAEHIKELLQPPSSLPSETRHSTNGVLSQAPSSDTQKASSELRQKTVGFAQQSFNSFKEFLPNKPTSGPLLTSKKKFYSVEERRRMLLSSSSSADLLKKSNLGAMMKFQMDKSKKIPGTTEKMAKILLWSNYPDETNLLHSVLESEGYEVVNAQNPNHVYHMLNISTSPNNDPLQYDILVLDADKPENLPPETDLPESGFALYDNIRLRYFPNELPVVFLSKLSSEQEERLLESNEYLTRPIHKAEFLSKVKNLVYIKKLNDVQTCFVPREFLDLLGCSTITDIKLGKVVQRVMTVIFVDIRSFTTLSESMTPQENFQFINKYLSVIGPAIRQHRGFIDKFMGDGTLAIFPKNSSDAIFAALAMQKIAQDFNFNSRKIQIGVGVNTGQIMLGIIGEDCRMSCDVISSTVNMSSRLEELTKHYKCKVIASEHSFLPAKDVVFGRELDHVRVLGIKEPIRIYEIWGADCDATPELVSKKERYEAGRRLYCERNFKEALTIFEELKKEQDVPSEIMYHRCLDLIEYPPKDGWSDIFQFKSK